MQVICITDTNRNLSKALIEAIGVPRKDDRKWFGHLIANFREHEKNDEHAKNAHIYTLIETQSGHGVPVAAIYFHERHELVIGGHDDQLLEEKILMAHEMREKICNNQTLYVSGVSERFRNCMQRVAEKGHRKYEFTGFGAYEVEVENDALSAAVSAAKEQNKMYDFRALTLMDAATVNQHWPYRRDGTERHIANIINVSQGIGVIHKQTGELVAWAIVQLYGAIGMVHCLEEHRRKGLTKCIIAMLSVNMLKQK